MQDFFLNFAPHILWLFVFSMPVEIYKNLKGKRYQSGTFGAWLMRLIGYLIFGTYSLMIGEQLVAGIQGFSAVLTLFILYQYFTYKR